MSVYRTIGPMVLFIAQNIDIITVSNVLSQKEEKYHNFSSENCNFGHFYSCENCSILYRHVKCLNICDEIPFIKFVELFQSGVQYEKTHKAKYAHAAIPS